MTVSAPDSGNTDTPRWTVEHQAGRSRDKAWWGPTRMGCYSDFDILWAGGPESDQAHAALVRCVRDADRLTQARELAAANAALFDEAIRGWLLSKHIPFSEIDAWADEITAIAADHPPWSP